MVIDCGRTYLIPPKSSITIQSKTNYGSAPWNVGIYRKINYNNYSMICAGTLISPNVVVTGKNLYEQY